MEARIDHLWATVTAADARELSLLRQCLTFELRDGSAMGLLVERPTAPPAFLAGLAVPLQQRLSALGVTLRVTPHEWGAAKGGGARREGEGNKGLLGVDLRDYQCEAVEACLAGERGIVHLPTGTGKTEIALQIVQRLDVRSIIVVQTIGQMKQFARRAEERGLSWGVWGGGECRCLGADVVVCVSASLVRGLAEGRAPELQGVGVIIFDEVHHLGTAATWWAIADALPCRYRFGFSATPMRGEAMWHDPWDAVLVGYTGPVLYSRPFAALQAYCPLVQVTLVRPMLPRRWVSGWGWSRVYRACVVDHAARNQMLVLLAVVVRGFGGRALLLVQQVRHGKALLHGLAAAGLRARMAMGQERVIASQRGQIVRLAQDCAGATQALAEGECDCLVGTTALHEAIDVPGATDIIIGGAGKAPIAVPQRIGRGMRGDKPCLRIWDIYDEHHPILQRQAQERWAIYERCGHIVRTIPALPGLLLALGSTPCWVHGAPTALRQRGAD